MTEKLRNGVRAESTDDGDAEFDQLITKLDSLVETLNIIPDTACYSGKTWEAIQKLREACSWLTVHRVVT